MQPTSPSLGEPNATAKSLSMNGIEHVVLLMLENRSLDSLLGWLYERDAPQHNIPPLRAGERSYEGLQGIDLNNFLNSSQLELRQNIAMSWDGILSAGNWGDTTLLTTDKRKREAIVARLLQYSNQTAAFFANKSDNDILGMAGAVIYLLGHGDRTADQLHKMSVEDHRNTLIVVMDKLTNKTIPYFQGKTTKEIVEEATNNRAWRKLTIPPIRGANALNCPNFSPGESFDEVKRQHFGGGAVPTMRGFIEDYVKVLKHDRGCSDAQVIKYADQVMRSYTPDQLPVLNGLAKHYAVCDMWFSSVPSQTNTNRAFAFCGTSKGLVNNGFLEEGDQAKSIEKLVGYKLGDDRFNAKTIFNALSENNTTWKIFFRSGLLQDNIAKLIDIYRGQAGASSLFAIPVSWALSAFVLTSELITAITLLAKGVTDSTLSYMRSLSDSSVNSMYSFRLFPEIKKIPSAKSQCEKFDKFHAAARAGKLPNFTFIEPVWSISPQSTSSTSAANVLYHLGDDYHPPCNLDGGENLVKSIYSSLIANRQAWEKTLFVITFDEPVGSFDHVAPPAAVAPWGNNPAPDKLEEKFGFNRYGGRVPTILVSPLIEKGTVFRSTTAAPFDHTSLIATLLKWRGLSHLVPEFGVRTANAPTFDNVVTRTTPRTDAADVKFLHDGLKLGDPVKYFDSFCLRNEDGNYLSAFKEDWAEGAVLGGALASEDAALTEFFPTLSDDINKATNLYCVNPFNRIDNSAIVRHWEGGDLAERSHVKLISLDSGLGSYTVLGVWKDSRDCYYSNDYTDGENDIKERWIINKATRDKDAPADKTLRFGQKIVIESQRYPEWFLDKDGSYVKTTRTDAMWTILPVGLQWTTPASKSKQGNWKFLSLSPKGEPLVGMAVKYQGGCGVINIQGYFANNDKSATPWTSDDFDGDAPRVKRSSVPGDKIVEVEIKVQGDYGIIDVRFHTRHDFESGWIIGVNEKDGVTSYKLHVPADKTVVGLLGRKNPGRGLMDLQLAFQ
ncbi:MAG TPA: alkaline phosphatase family protein [Cellvibrio sp.]|nr:alkaline phosphatase family protein [Cellvibrio sp.]